MENTDSKEIAPVSRWTNKILKSQFHVESITEVPPSKFMDRKVVLG